MDFGEYNIKIEDETLRKLAIISNGDVRTALNGLEVAVPVSYTHLRAHET